MRVAVCAKSPWAPSIRREHSLTTVAARHGVEVVFVESPGDVRALRRGRAGAGTWFRSLSVRSGHSVGGGTVVSPRSTLAPGHRGVVAAGVDCTLLRRRLEALHVERPLDAVVVQMPWQWGAVERLPMRRIFDAADDWTALIPERATWIERCYLRVASNADQVMIASPSLARLFPGAQTVLTPNGVDPQVAAGAPMPPPCRRRLAYLGTLSERFDSGFVRLLLEELPGWSIDLYGACSYAGAGERPGGDLPDLLALGTDRVRWHGPVDRPDVPRLLDAADVLLIPNDRRRSGGQSSMKMLDYAARGRPVVSTRWDEGLDARMAPGTAMVTSVSEAADAVVAATTESESLRFARVEWALAQSWDARWPQWEEALHGSQDARDLRTVVVP